MKKVLIRFGLVLLVIFLYIFICAFMCHNSNYSYRVNNNGKISKNLEDKSYEFDDNISEYYARVVIPKIGVDRYLYPIGSKENNVDKNIEILKESSMPDEGGNLILAAHNGLGNVAFFRYLHKLTIGDDVIISYKGTDYKYSVSDIYDIEKTGKATIKRDKSKTTITMITCLGEDRQLVVIGYLR